MSSRGVLTTQWVLLSTEGGKATHSICTHGTKTKTNQNTNTKWVVCSMPISCPVHKRWRKFNSIQIPQLPPNFTILLIVRCLLFNKICSTIVQEYVHSAFSSLCGRSKCNLICVVIWGGNEEDKTDFNHIFLPARLPTAALTISQGGVRVGRHCDIWTFSGRMLVQVRDLVEQSPRIFGKLPNWVDFFGLDQTLQQKLLNRKCFPLGKFSKKVQIQNTATLNYLSFFNPIWKISENPIL